jgi:hypothetical protein
MSVYYPSGVTNEPSTHGELERAGWEPGPLRFTRRLAVTWTTPEYSGDDKPLVTIGPECVEAAAAVVVAALQPGIEADWSVTAGDLKWSVDRTIAHMTGALGKYAIYLSSRSTRYVAVRVWPTEDATRQERLEAIEACAAALAGVAATAPEHAAGFHVTGMRSAQQFLAMACEELLIHAYDVTCGLGLPYEPPEELCRLVVEHCYPGQAMSKRPMWPFLVWLSGRRHPAATGWGQPPPLEERTEIPLEFGRDTATGEWRAIRWVTTPDA